MARRRASAAEEAGEAGDHAVFREAVGDLLIEGLEFYDGEVGIDGGQGLAGYGFHVGHGVSGLDHDGAGVEGGVHVDGRRLSLGTRCSMGVKYMGGPSRSRSYRRCRRRRRRSQSLRRILSRVSRNAGRWGWCRA